MLQRRLNKFMIKSLLVHFCVVAIGLSVLALYGNGQTNRPPNLDSYVRAVQEQFEVPGIAVSIVKDGKVVLTKGYGEKRFNTGEKVDERTLFCIASNTKAFTAAALGLLVEEGNLEWDTPIMNYIPWFQLSDSNVSRQLTVRDLLAHRTGLGYGAGNLLLWPNTTYSRKEIVRRLRFLPMTGEYRLTYGYNNMMYVVAGELIEAVSGSTWENFVTARILKQVGMKNSTVRRAASKKKVLNDNPAGGINSCAEDMAKWMICLLDSGRIAGKHSLYKPSTARELWTPITPISVAEPDSDIWPAHPTYKGYALGFRVSDYRGRKLVGHTGELAGYVSRVVMVPELNLGVAVLVNSRSSEAYQAIIHKVLDHYLGVQEFDWIRAYQRSKERTDSAIVAEQQKVMASRDRALHPTLPLARYARTYRDRWYGDIRIGLKKGRLNIRFLQSPSLVGTLEHYKEDTFIVRWKYLSRRSDAFVVFVPNKKGGVDHVTMKVVVPLANSSSDFHHLYLRPILEGGKR